MRISCVTEAVPWALLDDIVKDLRVWMRDRWAPVEASFRFLGANPYLVAAPAVIVVSIGLLVPLVKDLLGGGRGGGGGGGGEGMLGGVVHGR